MRVEEKIKKYLDEGSEKGNLDYVIVTKSSAEKKELEGFLDAFLHYYPALEDDLDLVKGKYQIPKEAIKRWKMALKDLKNFPKRDPDTGKTLNLDLLKAVAKKYSDRLG